MALPEQEVLGRKASRSWILSLAPPFMAASMAVILDGTRDPAPAGGPSVPSPFTPPHGSHRGGSWVVRAHERRGGFGVFARRSIAGDRAKTAFCSGAVPKRWRRCAWPGSRSFEQTPSLS